MSDGTTSNEFLASAIAGVIIDRLDTGTTYLRLPEIATPLPTEQILSSLAVGGRRLRVALFVKHANSRDFDGLRVTQQVPEAIDWRDNEDETPLVIIGDLERNRAAGLQDIRSVKAEAVKRKMLEVVLDVVRENEFPLPLLRVVEVLFADELNGVSQLAAYGTALVRDPKSMVTTARADLWRLGLLPDTFTAVMSQSELELNRRLITEIRRSDSRTLAQLARTLQPEEAYPLLRAYAQNPGRPEHLKDLDFHSVQLAFSKTKARRTTGDSTKGEKGSSGTSALELRQDAQFDEDDLLRQLNMESGESEPDAVKIAGSKESWDFAQPPENLSADGVDSYAEIAGGTLDRKAAATRATEAAGDVAWVNLTSIRDELAKLEDYADTQHTRSERCARLIDLRAELIPYLGSIPNEGVRLFYFSMKLRQIADEYVGSWLQLWEELAELHAALPSDDRVYAEQIAAKLVQTDVLLEISENDTTALLLPLHPIVLEPRIAAAKALEGADVDDHFIDLLASAADPGMPGFSVKVGGTTQPLNYAGQRNSLPYYQRVARSADSAELAASLRLLTERFINVHPFTFYNLAIVLVGPDPALVKRYINWLADSPPERIELDVFAGPRDVEEMHRTVDDARTSLAAREVAESKLVATIHNSVTVGTLPARLRQLDINPHIVLAFDLAEANAESAGVHPASPLQASVITQWTFTVNPISSSPIIRTLSGSGRLVDAGKAQQALTSLGPPAVQQSPLLADDAVEALARIGEVATWVGVSEHGSALAAPGELGDLHLIGRSSGSTHQTYVYSRHLSMLLEPVLTLLQQNTWLHPEKEDLAKFLLSTVRLATPEGLLGFYKAHGKLSNEAVLGRLGVAAALDYLQQTTSGDHLIISLDTEAARQWLDLRDDARRADLVVFSWDSAGTPCVTAVEVKARKDATSGTDGGQVVTGALGQITEMRGLFNSIFGHGQSDGLTPSRREILKRQVFLDALHQWDDLRGRDGKQYKRNIDRLNKLFDPENSCRVESKIVLVSTNDVASVDERTASDGVTSLVTLGVNWLRAAVSKHEAGQVVLDSSLLDQFATIYDRATEVRDSDQVDGSGTRRATLQTAATEGPPPDAVAQPPGVTTPATLPDLGTVSTPVAPDDVDLQKIGNDLRQVLLARKAPLRRIDLDQATIGPSVIQVPFKLAQGARLATLQSQEGDISRELGVSGSRIFNWLREPGYAAIEIPRGERVFADVGTLPAGEIVPGRVSVALGADIDFQPYRTQLDQMPHLLVGGTTGSGKSVFLRSILWQLTNHYTPQDLEIVVIDAKGMADYIDFSKAPHVTDFHLGAQGALALLADIVDNRLASRISVFNEYAAAALERGERVADVGHVIADSRTRGEEPPLRTLVVLIDEFAELSLATSDRKQFENLVTRFNQMARAIGGHLIAATQRPSTDIVPGVMKSNFARLALRVQSAVDSRVILDETGAEVLLGKGDLLYRSPETGTVRLQAYVAPGPYRFTT